MGLVTSKIFLTWANVARTNVAYTNVTVTVEICSRCSQKVWSKSGQLRYLVQVVVIGLLVVTGVKQSQFLVYGLSLEFDKNVQTH